MNDRRAEGVIGNLLRFGVLLSAAVVAAGGVWYLVRHGGEVPRYHVFEGAPPNVRNFSGIVRGVAEGQARAIIQLGLLLLIATPVARVAFSVVAFALERDYRYVAVTLVVLAVLVYSLAGGK